MDAKQQNEAISALCGIDEWVIKKNGFYYRPNAGGYTGNINEAWRVTHEVAKRHEMYADNPHVPFCDKVLIEKAPAPDYVGCLNAMHAAEATLTTLGAKLSYKRNLRAVYYNPPEDRRNEPTDWGFIHPTAAQRAEAFLRHHGKWVDSKPGIVGGVYTDGQPLGDTTTAQIPFNLGAALNGAPVITRAGRPVTTLELEGSLLTGMIDEEYPCRWFQDGRKSLTKYTDDDLFMATKVPRIP